MSNPLNPRQRSLSRLEGKTTRIQNDEQASFSETC
jgi:hypothetical protein